MKINPLSRCSFDSFCLIHISTKTFDWVTSTNINEVSAHRKYFKKENNHTLDRFKGLKGVLYVYA